MKSLKKRQITKKKPNTISILSSRFNHEDTFVKISLFLLGFTSALKVQLNFFFGLK